MKVGIWGAGTIGSGLAHRLTASRFVSELVWINRTFDKIEKQVIDLRHGLAFAPTCHTVRARQQSHAARDMASIEVLLLTLGGAVKPGETREEKYADNARIFEDAVLPALAEGFDGVVIVVSNPVDLMARLVSLRTELPAARVLGLGTVVETARLRGSLGSYLSPKRSAREVWAYAVGTHDPRFHPIAPAPVAVGDTTSAEDLEAILELARGEVVKAADRVKTESRSSLFPIVEGAVQVLEAVASDSRRILTVSVLDPASGGEHLYYSMPCTVGREGVLWRHDHLLRDDGARAAIEACCQGLRSVIHGSL